jgi:DNA-binding response OmpR family regulator
MEGNYIMISKKNKILIAEDEPDLIALMNVMLSPHFDVILADDGVKAKQLIETNDFLFLILDIHLPKMSGIELCQWVKESSKTVKPHIVITSGDISQNTITQAYALNIDDYIIKPISSLLFLQRMQRLERDILDIVNLEKDRALSNSIAQTSMQQASEYGSALELISRLNSIADSQFLAREVAKYFESKGYFTAVQLRSNQDLVTFDIDSHECSEIELKVFEVLHNQGRIYSFGTRTIFNDEYVSVLIKNMPSMDTHAYGVLVDIAAKIVPAINNRFISLSNELTISQSAKTLSDAIEMVSAGILSMELEKRQIIEDVIVHINASFHSLELTDVQENYFVSLIEDKLLKKEVGKQFLTIRDTLDNCLASIRNSQEMSMSAHESVQVDYQDVELF